MPQTSLWAAEPEVVRGRQGGLAPEHHREHHQPGPRSPQLPSSKDGFTFNLLTF